MSAASPPAPLDLERLDHATAGLQAPFAVVDLDLFDANAVDLTRRAGGLPIRVASKSVRCRSLLDRALGRSGFAGVMAYSVAEAVWLARHGHDDVLLGYPSVDAAALGEVGGDAELAGAITLMVDSVEQLQWLRHAVPGGESLRLCLDVDASLRVGRLHLGVRRSPVRTPAEAVAVARAVADSGGRFRLVGMMFYDAQIAGLPDSSLPVRLVKRRSHAELMTRRRAVVEAVQEVCPDRLEIVNGGGTGSLHLTGRDPVLTELAAGSGLYGPTLFDAYRAFTPRPAAVFALPVVRRPGRGVVTAFGGGYVASGPPGWSRVPALVPGQGLTLKKDEGTGEVQTPLLGRAADRLRLGDRVWFRHAKAGELLERFTQVHLVQGDRVVETVPSYRGEGRCFG